MKRNYIIFTVSLGLMVLLGNIDKTLGQCFTCGSTTGTLSTSFGSNSTSSGYGAFSAGTNATATGANSVAIGYFANTIGNPSFAFGRSVQTTADASFGFGDNLELTASGTFAIGKRLKATQPNAMVIGVVDEPFQLINNIPNSLMMGFNSSQPTFMIKGELGATGKVGICTTNPLFPLHVNGQTLVDGDGMINGTLFFKQNMQINPGTSPDFSILVKPASSGEKLDFRFMIPEDEKTVFTPLSIAEHGITVNGFLKTTQFRMETNAADDRVLVSDELGFGIWTDISGWMDSDWFFNEHGDLYANARNVGIGTQSPVVSLDVQRTNTPTVVRAFSLSPDQAGFWAANSIYAYGFQVDASGIGYIMEDGNNPVPLMTFDHGKVGIGTTNLKDEHTLYVKGGITSEEVRVELESCWSDYVFDDDFDLMSLDELGNYIRLNRHLPDVPTAEEVKQNGIDLGEMNALLLKKIEELTLYIIDLKEQVRTLQKQENHQRKEE